MNVTIKKIPEDVHEQLRKSASLHNRSLNGEIIEVLTAAAEQAKRLERRGEWREDLERFTKSLPPMPDSVPLIREDRDR